MFEILKGTPIKVITLDDGEVDVRNMKNLTLKRDALYDKHHVVVDPVGDLGNYNQSNCSNSGILGEYSSAGYYGFGLPHGSGFDIMLVKIQDVNYL